MKKQLIILGILALLVCVELSGCESEEQKLIGTWEEIVDSRNGFIIKIEFKEKKE